MMCCGQVVANPLGGGGFSGTWREGVQVEWAGLRRVGGTHAMSFSAVQQSVAMFVEPQG
jgi:hypothetical protein